LPRIEVDYFDKAVDYNIDQPKGTKQYFYYVGIITYRSKI